MQAGIDGEGGLCRIPAGMGGGGREVGGSLGGGRLGGPWGEGVGGSLGGGRLGGPWGEGLGRLGGSSFSPYGVHVSVWGACVRDEIGRAWVEAGSCTIPHDTTRYCTILHCTIHGSMGHARYCTAQHMAAWVMRDTTRYSTAQHISAGHARYCLSTSMAV